MLVKDLVNELHLNICSGEAGLGREVESGYTADLLSDVVAHAKSGDVWITLQTHKNIIAVASLKNLAAIILVKDNQPDMITRRLSNAEQIPVLSTPEDAFLTSGRLYRLLTNKSQ